MQSEVERFNRTLHEAFIARNQQLLAYDIDAFNRKLIDWLLWYNTRRPHWSLGLISPLKYICNQLPVPESQMLWTDTNPALRGRVQAGLNKGEARNALARAAFFNRIGEVRDRSFENQCYRASGLNLVVAAIILWNSVYLEKAVAGVRKRVDVPDVYLRYLSPLGWEHINLTGDYIWNLDP